MTSQDVLHSKILILDDEPANVELLQQLLEQCGFSEPECLTDSRLVFDRIDALDPDILLLDLQMPYVDGFAILEGIAARVSEERYFPVLVLTADDSIDTKRKALDKGASDFLTKPFDALEVVLRVKNLLRVRLLHAELRLQNQRLEERVWERTKELEDAQIEILWRLGSAAEYRDDDTGAHIRRVGELSAAIARTLGLPSVEVERMRLAAPLHDVGKIGIQDGILLKPGKLTPDEFGVMQWHAQCGALILSHSRSPLLQLAEEICMTHHERWDGTGYPRGLTGEAIPLSGRIVAVADVFDALTSDRPYKESWPVYRAVAEIESQSGSHFDPRVVRAFRHVLASRGEAQAQARAA